MKGKEVEHTACSENEGMEDWKDRRMAAPSERNVYRRSE